MWEKFSPTRVAGGIALLLNKAFCGFCLHQTRVKTKYHEKELTLFRGITQVDERVKLYV